MWDAETLRNLARDAPLALDAFLLWIGDGAQRGVNSKYILSDYARLASYDEQTAVRILRMPFLEEVDYPDSAVLSLLSGLAPWNKNDLDWILGRPTLEGGITDAQAADVFLLRLERKDPVAASSIRRLSWVEDGVTHEGLGEDETVIDLVEIALALPRVFQGLTARTWVHDELGRAERQMLNNLSNVSQVNDEEVAPLLGMPFLDAVDRTDARLVSKLLQPLWNTPYFITETLSRPALRGGITDANRAAAALLALETNNREAAGIMRRLRWLRDDIQPAEHDVFWTLWEAAEREEMNVIFRALTARPWMRDDVTAVESEVVDALMSIYYGNDRGSAEVVQLLGMPFLDGVESTDTAIVRTVERLPDGTQQVFIEHLSQGGGITTDDTPTTVALAALEARNPGLAAAIRALPWMQDG